MDTMKFCTHMGIFTLRRSYRSARRSGMARARHAMQHDHQVLRGMLRGNMHVQLHRIQPHDVGTEAGQWFRQKPTATAYIQDRDAFQRSTP
eukprot:m.147171 g.147171  ORF g.147171 m.147171 type:complete len:91 (+) comp17780_c0_seq2:1393-1665(+)